MAYTQRTIELTPRGLLRQLSWRGVLAVAVGATLLLTLVLVAGFVFLLILPIAVIAGLLTRWLADGTTRKPHPSQPEVLEGHYEVVEEAEVDRPRDLHTGNPWR